MTPEEEKEWEAKERESCKKWLTGKSFAVMPTLFDAWLERARRAREEQCKEYPCRYYKRLCEIPE